MLKDIKVKLSWQDKTLAEWLKMFSEDTPIAIHSYGVWCILLGSIEKFFKTIEEESYDPYNRYECISKKIVKKIYKDPTDYGDRVGLVFDVRGDDVYLWNKIIVDNRDPKKETQPGLRVPVKKGVDAKSIFRKEVEKWESEPFYMDDYAKSCLIHNDCLEMGNDS